MPKQTSRGRKDEKSPGAARRPKAAAGAGGRVTKATPEAGLAVAAASPRGAATLTEGLDRYDRERASSLADEGGMAGAAVEAQPPHARRTPVSGKLLIALLWGLAGLFALYLRRSR